jgi:phosphohistidine phosphatase
MTESVATRQLILLRHAKAAWPDVEDRLRPLAERGRRDAPAAGRWLREAQQRPNGFRLDQVVCSPANRTRETWELAAAELKTSNTDGPPEPIYDDRVYAATAAALLAVVRETPPHVHGLLLIGHNPGIQQLAGALAPDSSDDLLTRVHEKYPTSGIARFDVEVEWSALLPGRAQLVEFAVPRG